MSETSKSSNTHDPNRIAPRSRKVSTFEAFERYWVMGESSHDIGIHLHQRGIPTRDSYDAERLAQERVEIHELWSDYLSDFQISLAQEINRLRLIEQQSYDYEQ